MKTVTVTVPLDDGSYATIELPIEITPEDAERIATAISIYTVGEEGDE